MNIFDIISILLILLTSVIGYWKGIVGIFLGLAWIVMPVGISMFLVTPVTELLMSSETISQGICNIVEKIASGVDFDLNTGIEVIDQAVSSGGEAIQTVVSTATTNIATGLMMVVVFFLLLLICRIIFSVIRSGVKATDRHAVGVANHILGLLLGLACGIAIVVFAISIINGWGIFNGNEALVNSVNSAYITELIESIF